MVEERLRSLSENCGATLSAILLTGLNVLLSQWTGRASTTVGTVASGRGRTEQRGLVGCFVNVLPVRVQLDPGGTYGAALDRTKAKLVAALEHEDLPFDAIVRALVTRRAADYMPIFRVIFNHVAHARPPALAGIRNLAAEIAWPSGTSMSDLVLTVEERDEGLTAIIQYDSELFSAASISRLLSQYIHLLDLMARDRQAQVPEFPSEF